MWIAFPGNQLFYNNCKCQVLKKKKKKQYWVRHRSGSCTHRHGLLELTFVSQENIESHNSRVGLKEPKVVSPQDCDERLSLGTKMTWRGEEREVPTTGF